MSKQATCGKMGIGSPTTAASLQPVQVRAHYRALPGQANGPGAGQPVAANGVPPPVWGAGVRPPATPFESLPIDTRIELLERVRAPG